LAFESRKVLPTKINLIRLRRELKSMKRIRRVLEEKRDVLLLYIRQLIDEYEETYKKVAEYLMSAYQSYLNAVAESGYEAVRAAADSIPPTLTVNIETKILFAVKAPSLSVDESTVPPLAYSLTHVSPRIVPARNHMVEGLKNLLKLVEVEATLEKMIMELRETQRLLNALDYLIIPRYESAIKFIRRVLDDRMREEILRVKLMKKRLEKRARASRPIARAPQRPSTRSS